MSKPLLISMHMEKCGGTSMETLLRKQYGQAFQLYDPGSPQAPIDFTPGADIVCLHGHMFYGLHRLFAGMDCSYITLLRDPVTRFLSNYQHIRSYQHPLHEHINKESGLQYFCESDNARHYRNLFVRRLAGVNGEPGAQDLDLAEGRLRQFALVGRVEQFEAFLLAAADRSGWSSADVPHENAAHRPLLEQGFSGIDLALVSKANALDIELMQRVEDLIIG